MKFRKTPLTERNSYIYHFADGTVSKITPDKDGATTVDIKSLHALDDSEVYFNIENARPKLTEEEKLANKDWESNHFGEKAPKNWTLSIEQLTYNNHHDNDKGKEMLELAKSISENNISTEVLFLRDFIKTLPISQQKLYQLKYIEEYSQTEIAEILGVSNMAITNRIKRLEVKIKNNFKNFCKGV